ncbi:MAG TPA: hypothetical protein DD379_23775 [Cyanobacteria bacterium UBA11162]|nr:hypothetical protein [Cyanobacteria bacterium UBA11162]
MTESSEDERRLCERNSEDAKERLGETRGSSENIQHEPNQIPDSDRTGRDTNWSKAAKTLGKILSRVEKIEADYISYLKAHEDRLRTRLDENLRGQIEAVEDIQQLKDEIARLIMNEIENRGTNEINEAPTES